MAQCIAGTLTGVPRKAGHFIASMTYCHDRLSLAGPGEVIHVG